MAIQCCYFPPSLFFKWSKNSEENEKQTNQKTECYFWQMGEIVKIASPKGRSEIQWGCVGGTEMCCGCSVKTTSQEGKSPWLGTKPKFLLGHRGIRKPVSVASISYQPRWVPSLFFSSLVLPEVQIIFRLSENQLLAFFSLLYHYFLFY